MFPEMLLAEAVDGAPKAFPNRSFGGTGVKKHLRSSAGHGRFEQPAELDPARSARAAISRQRGDDSSANQCLWLGDDSKVMWDRP